MSNRRRTRRQLATLAGLAAIASLRLVQRTGPLAAPLLAAGPVRAAGPELSARQLMALREGGTVLMLRHAATEAGVGDPPGYRLDDCGTQRNLSAEGRAQSERLGAWWRERGLKPAAVQASAWCRCQDTARLAFGRSETWAALNSFFDDRSREPAQTAQLREALKALREKRGGGFEVWVTHQVNIVALAGESLSVGQGLLLRSGPGTDAAVENLGRLNFEA
jgi:phosphohistidine phosphatase SixA